MLALDDLNSRNPRRVPLLEIDAIVAARLGPGRVAGNAQPAAFSRHIAMYMASHVGWSTTQIGRFYNGRDHSTVCYAIARIKERRRTEERIEGLLTVLASEIREREHSKELFKSSPKAVTTPRAVDSVLQEAVLETLAERIATRLLPRLIGLQHHTAARAGAELKMAQGCAERARELQGEQESDELS